MYSRRDLFKALGVIPFATPACLTRAGRLRDAAVAAELPHRLLGRTGRWVVPLGLGGQASIQWTAPGVDPADIVVRAVELGVNYLDTANAYGPSQLNYGEAFRRLHLVPSDPDYNAALRERLFVATKTGRRYARDASSGATTAIDDLERSLTQLFGDGRGWIPDGAYLDSMQIHNLTSLQQVDQIYQGMDRRDDLTADRTGALAGLLDYRDGTNYTGLNPEHKRYLRHIGITGHQSSPVLMNALQRDEEHIVDTLLVALNANDRRYSSHQHNVVPVALARQVGIIAMKAFADGVFYGKAPRFSNSPSDVVRSVGKSGAVDYADLVRYAVSVPGVTTLITGIGQIDRDNPLADQLVANLAAATQDEATELDRLAIEGQVAQQHGVNTNYFQERRGPVQPADIRIEYDDGQVTVSWDSALAGAKPITAYHIYAGSELTAAVPFTAQATRAPLSVALPGPAVRTAAISVVAVEQE
jgi:aryl-alcohol dehydrogenase-like predicted oxidoreductase